MVIQSTRPARSRSSLLNQGAHKSAQNMAASNQHVMEDFGEADLLDEDEIERQFDKEEFDLEEIDPSEENIINDFRTDIETNQTYFSSNIDAKRAKGAAHIETVLTFADDRIPVQPIIPSGKKDDLSNAGVN